MECLLIMPCLFICSILCMSTSKTKDPVTQTIQVTTKFYTPAGKVNFFDSSIIRYYDSTTIQEFHTIDIVVTADKKETTTYKTILYRYIDLRSRTWYTYITLSDTATIINKGVLPDTAFTDYGWSYFSGKVLQIQRIPEKLSDTTIDNISYKRAKFSFVREDPQRNFTIGFFRCDGKGSLFSIEKQYSSSINCTLVKTFSYRSSWAKPYASSEVDFISETVPTEIIKVFESWKRNAKEHPTQ